MIFSLALAIGSAEIVESSRRISRPDEEERADVIFLTEVDHDNFELTPVVEDDMSTHEFRVAFAEIVEDWTPRLETRYADLLVKGALGELTKEQKKELDWLQREKRNLLNPRPIEEIIAEARMNKVTEALISAFDKYVQHKQASTWKDPKAGFYKLSKGAAASAD